jgi:hypothetical protein
MQIVRQQEAEKDALGAVHPIRRIQEQGPRAGRYILLRVIPFHRRMRGTGKLLRQNALREFLTRRARRTRSEDSSYLTFVIFVCFLV